MKCIYLAVMAVGPKRHKIVRGMFAVRGQGYAQQFHVIASFWLDIEGLGIGMRSQ
ncbi:hypothetical protein [Streptomyces sp. 1222.5]|uniref:hypothetical protein n=1 Tax=Streptomyces sp. 1222.5 TaxID=1881026 RepID=UPI003D71077E